MMIDVSCILINFNTSEFTAASAKSIIDKHEAELSYEIIIIDNASEIEDYYKLQKALEPLNDPRVKLVRSKQNVGFGAGNMLGVQSSSPCKFYAFINNDTLQVTKNCLVHLKNFMANNSDAGLCSPQMLDENKNFRVTIDHFSSLPREILRRPFLESLFPGTYLNRKKTYTEPTKVHYVQGSFMFVDAQDFNSIGGFDTNLFLYYEESDLSLRLLKERKKFTYLVPELLYIHYKGASTKRNIFIKIEQKISLIYYTRKHHGYLQSEILISYFIIRYFFTCFIKPQYLPLLKVLLRGGHVSDSLKLGQKININK